MKLTGGIIALFLRNVLSKGHRSALIKTHPLFGRLALNPWPLSKRFRAPSFNVQLGGPLRLSICLFTDVTASPVARDEKAPCISARPGFTLIIVPFFFFFFFVYVNRWARSIIIIVVVVVVVFLLLLFIRPGFKRRISIRCKTKIETKVFQDLDRW